MHELEDLPILAELGDQLMAGFRRREARRLPAGRLLAAVTAAAAITLVVVLAWGVGGSGFGSAEASAAQALRAAADAAARQPDSFPRPDQFFYIRWLTSGLEPVRTHADEPMPRADESLPKARVKIETWEWWSKRRVGEIRSQVLSVTFPTAAARSLWEKLGRPALGGVLPAAGIAPGPIEIPLDPHVLSLSQVLRDGVQRGRGRAATRPLPDWAESALGAVPSTRAGPRRPSRWRGAHTHGPAG
jgi:hypothetical protein